MRPRMTAAIALALLMIMAPGASASSDTATVYIVHGIPSPTVDVYVNGDLALEDFEVGTITDALELPAGTYTIEIYRDVQDPASDDPFVAGAVDLAAGDNVSIVAHLAPDGHTLSVFPNDVSPLGAGEARVTVRNTASAPGMDVLVGGSPVLTGIEAGEQGVADVVAGNVAAIEIDGSDEMLGDPSSVELAEGVNTIIYVVGLLSQSLELFVQTIDGLHEAPSGVESGSGGLKALDDARPRQLAWVVGLSTLTVIGAGFVMRRSTHPAPAHEPHETVGHARIRRRR